MLCAYCGDIADTYDHVVPVSYGGKPRAKGRRRQDTVPCCRECNNILGNKLFHSVGGRAGYLCEAYPRRYAKLLAFPEWDEDELDELGHALRTTVQKGLAAKHETIARIERCRSVAVLAPTIEEIWTQHDERLERMQNDEAK